MLYLVPYALLAGGQSAQVSRALASTLYPWNPKSAGVCLHINLKPAETSDSDSDLDSANVVDAHATKLTFVSSLVANLNFVTNTVVSDLFVEGRELLDSAERMITDAKIHFLVIDNDRASSLGKELLGLKEVIPMMRPQLFAVGRMLPGSFTGGKRIPLWLDKVTLRLPLDISNLESIPGGALNTVHIALMNQRPVVVRYNPAAPAVDVHELLRQFDDQIQRGPDFCGSTNIPTLRDDDLVYWQYSAASYGLSIWIHGTNAPIDEHDLSNLIFAS